MREYVLEREQLLPLAVEDVFPFFADAGNLDAITPTWLNFQILTPLPVEMRVGLLLEYKLRWHGFPIRWRTVIEDWEPNVRFVDRQLRGPYKLWHHTHTFAPHPDGTLMTDRVRYALPLGPFGALAYKLRVRADVERIFDYRFEAIARRFGGDGRRSVA